MSSAGRTDHSPPLQSCTSTTVRAALESLKLLENLYLSECDIIARTGSLLPLKSFGLLSRQFESGPQVGALHFIAPDNLHQLTVGSHVDAEPMFKALGSDPLPRLSRITVLITACAFECFPVFLACCPQLESIHIRPYYGIGDINPISLPDPLPATTLPILKSFRGPFVLAGRFVRNRPAERVELDGSGTEIAAETVLSTLSAVSEGSVSLRTLSIAPAFPVEASPEIFQTVGSCFPDLCSLKLEFIDQDRELSSVADSDEDPEEGGVASDAEDTIDTRTVVLPEGTSVPRAADEESAPVFPDKRKLRQESLPENLLPGYLYNHGGVYPPNPDRLEPDDESSPLATVMDASFSPWVGKSEFDTDEQHQTILLLETFVPTLREIGFCDSQDRWLRDRHVWIRDPSAAGRINWGEAWTPDYFAGLERGRNKTERVYCE
ncbi:hypothetical protein MSAN_02216000 [Mycena sanguinolenta]|uniref:Uncharacterized protein n=1 Tax=Mycena sanguinolenta TaxID=230812 RepID=A0A8H6XE91_9AGAR|nr:hypothetical protein MSAN_02216000 [Mycena sanguinolenta]